MPAFHDHPVESKTVSTDPDVQKTRQKPFSFLDLPAEVRNLIYTHTLNTPAGFAALDLVKARARHPCNSLLLVSRQIHEEAKAIIYSCNFIYFAITRAMMRLHPEDYALGNFYDQAYTRRFNKLRFADFDTVKFNRLMWSRPSDPSGISFNAGNQLLLVGMLRKRMVMCRIMLESSFSDCFGLNSVDQVTRDEVLRRREKVKAVVLEKLGGDEGRWEVDFFCTHVDRMCQKELRELLVGNLESISQLDWASGTSAWL